ncbi:MAG: hypothetical protein II868_09040, partial [Butyrivibrio sp.]|nr:hypothetical protein [Butyrivibrio sp.]
RSRFAKKVSFGSLVHAARLFGGAVLRKKLLLALLFSPLGLLAEPFCEKSFFWLFCFRRSVFWRSHFAEKASFGSA